MRRKAHFFNRRYIVFAGLIWELPLFQMWFSFWNFRLNRDETIFFSISTIILNRANHTWKYHNLAQLFFFECVLCIFHSSSSTLLFLLLILCLCLFSFLYLFAQFANATFSLIQTIMICINNAPICDSASDNCLTNNKINSAPFEIHNVQSKSNYIHLNQSNQIIFYQVKFKERSQSNSKCNTTWKYA